MTDDELAKLIGRPVERKWKIVLTRDDRWFSRLPDGWHEVKPAGTNPQSS